MRIINTAWKENDYYKDSGSCMKGGIATFKILSEEMEDN